MTSLSIWFAAPSLLQKDLPYFLCWTKFYFFAGPNFILAINAVLKSTWDSVWCPGSVVDCDWFEQLAPPRINTFDWNSILLKEKKESEKVGEAKTGSVAPSDVGSLVNNAHCLLIPPIQYSSFPQCMLHNNLQCWIIYSIDWEVPYNAQLHLYT